MNFLRWYKHRVSSNSETLFEVCSFVLGDLLFVMVPIVPSIIILNELLT